MEITHQCNEQCAGPGGCWYEGSEEQERDQAKIDRREAAEDAE